MALLRLLPCLKINCTIYLTWLNENMVCLYVHVAQMALLLTLSPAEEHTHTFVLQ